MLCALHLPKAWCRVKAFSKFLLCFYFPLQQELFLPGYVHCEPNINWAPEKCSISGFGKHTGNFCLVFQKESLSVMMFLDFLHSPCWWCWRKHLSWTRWFSAPVTQICVYSGGAFKSVSWWRIIVIAIPLGLEIDWETCFKKSLQIEIIHSYQCLYHH